MSPLSALRGHLGGEILKLLAIGGAIFEERFEVRLEVFQACGRIGLADGLQIGPLIEVADAGRENDARQGEHGRQREIRAQPGPARREPAQGLGRILLHTRITTPTASPRSAAGR